VAEKKREEEELRKQVEKEEAQRKAEKGEAWRKEEEHQRDMACKGTVGRLRQNVLKLIVRESS